MAYQLASLLVTVLASFQQHWSFEESTPVTQGVVSQAAVFPQASPVQVSMGFLPALGKLEQLSVSAWIRPTQYEQYNEVFRQECQQRILFSLQEHATILSLGLNVGGYIECDAPISREEVFDGNWHFVAGTFDGKAMRVYLDGDEIGHLSRPGVITVDPVPPGFIGSSGGGSEFFHGGIDELVLSDTCLSPEQIAKTYREISLTLDNSLGLKNRIDARFTAMTEYMPLTSDQWDLLSETERAKWEKVKQLANDYASFTLAFDGTPESTAKLLEFAKSASAMSVIDSRPQASEPVSPYVVPATPAIRTYDAASARKLLEADWLYQADGKPTAARTLQEIDWATQLALRLMHSIAAGDSKESFFNEALKKLVALKDESQQLHRNPSASLESQATLYFKVRKLKRDVMLANPVLDFSQMLFLDTPYPAGSEWQHETRHRLGYMSVPGAQLLLLDGLAPDGVLKRLAPQEPLHGAFWKFDLSHDAQKILFCFNPHNDKSFHIYEMNIDGTDLRQITSGMFDDFDPVYLPDGENFVFSTTRGYTYVRCMPPTNAYVLARCGLDSSNLYIISGNNEPDYLPSIMNDGKIIYTRWEYTDKPLWRAQSLWTMNPDGTQSNTFWGNQSVWPDLLKDARAIPNSRRVMFTGSAHHSWFDGSVGIIDPDQGLDFPHGLTKVTADVIWPESGNGPADPIESPAYHASGAYSAYFSPYPLSEKDFLVSANKGGKFSLYLMDVDGNRELLYEGNHNIFHAIPVRPRAVPPIIPDRTDWPTIEERFDPSPGYMYSSNVYEGTPPELAGKAKYLRILHIEPKTYTQWNQRPYASTGPVVSMVQSEGVKRVLGTVPIQDDGSVSFEAPSGIALHFQLLDENHRALQTMRSFVNVMPGESRGCLGCHALQHNSAENTANRFGKAVQMPPSRIAPVPWAYQNDFAVSADSTLSIQDVIEMAASGVSSVSDADRKFVARNGTAISYTHDVQPVLDKTCGKCHQGDGEGRKVFDMTRRPGFMMFDEPYVTLIGAPNWGGPGAMPTGAWGGGRVVDPDKTPPGFGIAGMIPVEAFDQRDPKAYETFPPMTLLSYRSKLIEIAATGRHSSTKVDPSDVKIDPVSLLRLILWVDAMCPYISDDEIRAMPDPVFQGSAWLSIPPKLESAPRIVRPGPFEAHAGTPAEFEASTVLPR